MTITSILLFTTIYLYLCNWFQIKTFLYALIKPKERVTTIHDPWIIKTVKKKTHLQLRKILIFETEKMFGFMPSLSINPKIVLSRGMYTSFTKDELEWVILHEAAHCIFWHGLKLGVAQALFFGLGICISLSMRNIFLVPFFAIIHAILYVQYAHYLEKEADVYSIQRVGNIYAVISANEKLRDHYSLPEKSILRRLFYYGLLPSERISLASEEISKSNS